MSRKRKHKALASSSGEKEVAASGIVSRMRKLFGSKSSSVVPEREGMAEARADSPSVGVEPSLPKPSGESEAPLSVKPEADVTETPLPELSVESEASDAATSPESNIGDTTSEPSAEESDSMQNKAHKSSICCAKDSQDVEDVHLHIPHKLMNHIRLYCVITKSSVRELVTESLEEYLVSHPIPGVPMETIVRKMNKSNKDKK